MKKILVAEDDLFLANAYKAKLSKSGFEVLVARDGKEALDILAKEKVSLVLLDLMMPVKDGFEVLAEMDKKIPVLVASNLGQKEDIDKAMKLGAKDYIIKSDVSLTDLISKVNSLC